MTKLEIIIAAKDLATGVVQTVNSATRAYKQTLQEANSAANEFSGTIRNLFLSFGGYAVIKNAVSAGYSFNSTMEETRVGLGSLIYSMREFRDKAGDIVTGQRAFEASLRLSVETQNRLRIAGLETAATYEQLTKAYTQSYVPALKAGFDEKMVVNFSTAIVQVATSMRVPLDMLGEEVRSILTGNMTPRTTMLQPLMEAAGLTNEKIRQLNATGKLYPAVMKALEGATVGAAEASKNLSVQLSNLKDAATQALGKGMEIGFQKTKSIIKDVTDSIVTFNKETGEIKWNESLIVSLQKMDEKIFSIIDGIRDMSKAISDFTKNHPVIVDLLTGFGGLAVKILAVGVAIRAIGGTVTWLASLVAANVAFMAGLFAPVVASIESLFAAALAGAGGLATMATAAALAAGTMAGIGAAFIGWKLGQQIAQMEILGLTIGEAMQAGYASVAKFGAYAVYAWDMIGATAKSVWGQVKEAGKSLFYEFIATIQESFPKMAQFFGLTEDYRKKADSARSSQSAIYQDFIKNQTAAKSKLKQELNVQESIREEIFRGADARNKIKDATDSATKSTEDLTAGSRKGKAAAVEYSLAHSAVNSTLDRMSDILKGAKEKVAEFATEIKKLTATSHGAKLIDIEDAYRKDMAAVEKYKTDMERTVRELQEKISKAQKDAAKKNAKRDANDPITAVDPSLQADAQNMLKLKQELVTNVEILERQAKEKRDIALAQEKSENLVSVRSFVAAQTQEYTQLTGNILAGYKAEADALRAKLAEELADVKKSAEEKAAITLLYNEKIRQAEVVKPAEYDRAAREAEINNRLASLDLIEAEGTAHRNTINERIRLTEELIALQRQSLAAMPKTGNEQAWNAQMDKIIAEQKKRAELVREQLMNSPIEAMKLGFKDLLNKWTDVGQQMYDVSQTTATAMRDAFSDIFFDAFQGKLKSVGDYITSFVNSVNRAIANYLANMAAAGLIGAVKSGISSFFNLGTSGNSSLGSSTSTISGNSTGNYLTVDQSLALGSHGGGIAGREAPAFYRMVPNLAFAGAPRFHGGFAPDEYPAVLQRGEGVFTAGQMKAMGLMVAGSGGDSGPNVEVNIINQSGTELSGKQRGAPKFDGRKWVLDIVVEGMERYAPLRTAVGNMRG